jgi:hypothetical protein
VRDNYGRNQLQKRMEAFIENQQKQKKWTSRQEKKK